MPIISQMISSGSAAAMSLTKSHSPRGATRVDDRRAPARAPSSSTRADHARREALVDQQAQLGVARRVHVDHRAEELEQLDRQVADVGAAAGDEQLGRAAHRPHVLPARHRPEPGALRQAGVLELLVPRHRPLGAQAAKAPSRSAPDSIQNIWSASRMSSRASEVRRRRMHGAVIADAGAESMPGSRAEWLTESGTARDGPCRRKEAAYG